MDQKNYCRRCGTEIKFIKTAYGKKHPVNVNTKEMFCFTDGQWQRKLGLESHFATCAYASRDRKERGHGR